MTIKIAISLDGKIALKNKDSKWISSKLSRNFGHMLRAQSDAILTTNSTIKEDNSKLTCRLNGLEKYSPLKIIVDRNLKLNNDYLIFKKAKKFFSQQLGKSKSITTKTIETFSLNNLTPENALNFYNKNYERFDNSRFSVSKYVEIAREMSFLITT